jgi:hypothetical protein
MPSPDLQSYSSLTLYDVDPRALVDRAVTDGLVKFPGWTPREGNTELALIELLGLEVAEAVFAINRLPDAVVEVLMRLFGITRNLGAPAAATATFTLSDALGHVIPAGTRVRLELAAGQAVDFTTDVALVVAGGAVAGTVAITAVTSTADANGTGPGVSLALVDAVPYIETVVTATAVGAGAAPHDHHTRRGRAVTLFSSLTSTLVAPSDFTAAALQWPTVYRATTVDQWDPTLAGGAGGAANGHVTVAVIGLNNAALTAGDKANLLADLDAKAYGPLVVHVVDPTVTAQNVTVDVKVASGYAPVDVQAAVVAALTDYLSPNTWPWSPTVRRNELIALVSGVAGVDYVTALTVPAADTALPGAAPLANAGVLTVTTS